MTDTYFTSTLAEAFDRSGLIYPGEPEPGRLLRFSTNARDSTDRAGWLSMLPDSTAAAFGCWREGTSFCWQRRDTNANPPSQDERDKARQKGEKARIRAEQERAETYANAASECASLWATLKPAPASHDYLQRKEIAPHLARVDPSGKLVLPVFDDRGTLQSLQSIAPDGTKRFFPGGKMKDGRLYLGKPTYGKPIVLAEGFATGASIFEAAGVAVCIGFSGGNLKQVAESLRRLFPNSPLLVAGDLDASGVGKKYAEAAAEAGAPVRVILPTFRDGRAAGDFNDLCAAEGREEVRRQVFNGLKPETLRYKLLTDSDLSKLPPLIFRIKGVLPSEGVAAIYGPSGSGKSFLVLDMLQALAVGADWFERRATACPVIYCALEGEGGIAGRVNAYRARHGTAAENIRYLVQPFSLLEAGDVQDLAKAIEVSGGAGVVVLDTLNRAAPGADENDSKAMGQIIAAAKQLQTLVGGLVLLVHHTGKDATKGLRGHSSLHAALDAAIEVRRDGDRREWLIAKAKDGEDGASHPFTLDVVELGVDEDGESVTSCVVHPVDDVGDHIRRVLPPKSGNQKSVWDALGEVFRKTGERRPEGAPDVVPSGRPCVTLEHAIEQTRSRLVCEPKRQTERCQAAIRGLVERGLLCHEGGFLWCK